MLLLNLLECANSLEFAKELDAPDGIQSLIKHNQVKIYHVVYFTFSWFVLKSDLITVNAKVLSNLYEKYRLYGNRLKENSSVK